MAEPLPNTNGVVQLVKEKGREYLAISVPAVLVVTIIGTLTAWWSQSQTNALLIARMDHLEVSGRATELRLSRTEEATEQLPAVAAELSATTRAVNRLEDRATWSVK